MLFFQLDHVFRALDTFVDCGPLVFSHFWGQGLNVLEYIPDVFNSFQGLNIKIKEYKVQDNLTQAKPNAMIWNANMHKFNLNFQRIVAKIYWLMNLHHFFLINQCNDLDWYLKQILAVFQWYRARTPPPFLSEWRHEVVYWR